MKSNMIPRPGIMQKHQNMAYSGSSVTSQPGSLTHAAWQSNLSAEAAARGAARSGGGPQLVIPRAKMKPRSRYEGYNSDEDGLSAEVIYYILHNQNIAFFYNFNFILQFN